MKLYIFRQEISIALLVVRVSCLAISVQECLLYAQWLILQFRYVEFCWYATVLLPQGYALLFRMQCVISFCTILFRNF
jgi:hypothetical protein